MNKDARNTGVKKNFAKYFKFHHVMQTKMKWKKNAKITINDMRRVQCNHFLVCTHMYTYLWPRYSVDCLIYVGLWWMPVLLLLVFVFFLNSTSRVKLINTHLEQTKAFVLIWHVITAHVDVDVDVDAASVLLDFIPFHSIRSQFHIFFVFFF